MEGLCRRLGIDESALRREVAKDLAGLPGVKADGFKLTEIPGGASLRGYCRIHLRDRARPSLALMVLSDPDPAKGVEEVMAAGVIKELPFINVHRHLQACAVPVPELYHYNRERGLIYLEDLGEVHLRNLAESNPDLRRQGFELAVRELTKIQVDCTRRPAADFLGFLVKFDHDLLMWELNHFTEYAIKNRFPGSPSPEDDARIAELFEDITRELLAGPYALQHRDYHMDNLMYKDGRLRVIDFQDALMGPLAYDLACLLYDRDTSFILGRELVAHLVDYYAEEFEKRGGEPLDRQVFRRNFELCVIHRLLKVVGRFHFIDQVKKRPDFLRFNQYMLPAIADYLSRDRKGTELLSIIVRYVPELAEITK